MGIVLHNWGEQILSW